MGIIIEHDDENIKADESKKENSFSKLWKKTKQSVSDSLLENKIESTFRSLNREATVYTKTNLLSDTIYGYLENNSFVCFGEEKIKDYSVLITEGDDIAYYVTKTEETTVCIVVDGIEYERPATRILLDKNVEEVEVVKAGKRYFIYKG